MLRIFPYYRTESGAAYIGDSRELLAELEESSIDLVMTSPPFALRRKKTYGNVDETEYVEWLLPFAQEIHRVLKDTGSFVLDLGGAYRAGIPSRSLYNFRVLIAFCDKVGFHLAEDFYWFNPAKLPSPIEWVNKKKMRAKDSVNTVWWFSKTPFPKADIRKVLVPYSERMKKLLKNPGGFYEPCKRPSGHDISRGFDVDNGGAIPSNLLSIPNTDSNSYYLRMCKHFGLERHPARYPEELPSFFIKMLTTPGDVVLDIFAGSNTTGRAAERLARKWVSFDDSLEYLKASSFRFAEGFPEDAVETLLRELSNPQANFIIPANCTLLENNAGVEPENKTYEKPYQQISMFR